MILPAYSAFIIKSYTIIFFVNVTHLIKNFAHCPEFLVILGNQLILMEYLCICHINVKNIYLIISMYWPIIYFSNFPLQVMYIY